MTFLGPVFGNFEGWGSVKYVESWFAEARDSSLFRGAPCRNT